MIEKTERFEMRMDQSTIENVDRWRANQNDNPTRSEAVRRLINKGIQSDFSDGEKLITHMLCDIFKHLKINGEINPKFISSALVGGHYWALKSELSGIFHDHSDKKQSVNDVVDTLDMWSFIESGYAKLSIKQKELIKKEVPIFGEHVVFRGFDGNYESEHCSIAYFIVNDLNRFPLFAKRDLNSHVPMMNTYKRMFKVFEPIRVNIMGGELGTSEIIKILNAK